MNKEAKYLLHPKHSTQHQYGLQQEEHSRDHDDDDNDGNESDGEDDEIAKANLLRREEKFTISYDVQKGYRGTELKLTSFARPHMYVRSKGQQNSPFLESVVTKKFIILFPAGLNLF